MPDLIDAVCPWCHEPLLRLKPAGGCLIGETPLGVLHAACADEYEVAQAVERVRDAGTAPPEAGE